MPRYAAGVKFRMRHDEAREAWVVLAPERLFVPDDQAVEILRLVDGERTTLRRIVDDLAASLRSAPRR